MWTYEQALSKAKGLKQNIDYCVGIQHIERQVTTMSKTINMEKELGGLSPEARKQFAVQFNGGLGSGMSPEENRMLWRKVYTQELD